MQSAITYENLWKSMNHQTALKSKIINGTIIFNILFLVLYFISLGFEQKHRNCLRKTNILPIHI